PTLVARRRTGRALPGRGRAPGAAARHPAAAACSELDHHHALLGHVAHGVVRSLARVPGLFRPAVGHLVDAEGGRLVDRDAAELEPLACGNRSREVTREDARLETVVGVVRQADRLLERLERAQPQYRTED